MDPDPCRDQHVIVLAVVKDKPTTGAQEQCAFLTAAARDDESPCRLGQKDGPNRTEGCEIRKVK